jgi:diguanylate cyclase (GGDEF)-like protein
VVRDATEQVEHLRELEHSRAIAVREANRARELAATDPLTSLANRRSVMDRLDRLIVDATASGEPLSLLMFDIDHFKRVNDTYGHPEGDRLLRQVAQIVRRQARADDLVGRVGGEEFVWAIPRTTVSQVQSMAERLRLAISTDSGWGDVPPVTVSIGFACWQTGDTTLSLFARADRALYEAKHDGRNRIRIAA